MPNCRPTAFGSPIYSWLVSERFGHYHRIASSAVLRCGCRRTQFHARRNAGRDRPTAAQPANPRARSGARRDPFSAPAARCRSNRSRQRVAARSAPAFDGCGQTCGRRPASRHRYRRPATHRLHEFGGVPPHRRGLDPRFPRGVARRRARADGSEYLGVVGAVGRKRRRRRVHSLGPQAPARLCRAAAGRRSDAGRAAGRSSGCRCGGDTARRTRARQLSFGAAARRPGAFRRSHCRVPALRVRAREAAQISSIPNFVAAGLGVAIVPASIAALQVAGVRYVPILGDQPIIPLSIATRTGERSAVLTKFLDNVIA
jgi:hypothetical protein